MAFTIDFSTVRNRQKAYWGSVLSNIFGKNPPLALDKGEQATPKLAEFTYDFASQGGAIGAIKLGKSLPSGAILTKAYYDVITTFTTAGADAGTLALSVQAANDIVSAIAVSDVSNPWDSGKHATILVGTAATMIKLTADRDVTVTIAGQAVTAGKLKLFVEYVISE